MTKPWLRQGFNSPMKIAPFFLRFILGRSAFRNDINDKFILCKNSDNSQEYVVNEYPKTEKLRTKLTKELNDLNNAIKNKTLMDYIFYLYYSEDLQAKKSDNKGIRFIKKYVLKLYKLMKGTFLENEQEA